MYWVFLSNIKNNSSYKEYLINKNLDLKGFEIIYFNNLNIKENYLKLVGLLTCKKNDYDKVNNISSYLIINIIMDIKLNN